MVATGRALVVKLWEAPVKFWLAQESRRDSKSEIWVVPGLLLAVLHEAQL